MFEKTKYVLHFFYKYKCISVSIKKCAKIVFYFIVQYCNFRRIKYIYIIIILGSKTELRKCENIVIFVYFCKCC